jgi:hypothetical protein
MLSRRANKMAFDPVADAAAILASIVPRPKRTFTFSNDLLEIPARKGMAGVDAVIRSQPPRRELAGPCSANGSPTGCVAPNPPHALRILVPG